VALVAVIGLFVTWFFLPEPKGQTLEQISRDNLLRMERAGA
jgi:hypothetical protein